MIFADVLFFFLSLIVVVVVVFKIIIGIYLKKLHCQIPVIVFNDNNDLFTQNHSFIVQ